MIRRALSIVPLSAAVVLMAGFVGFRQPASVTAGSVARDAYTQPFASTSIWNQPIGSGAAYVSANIAPPTVRALTADQTYVFMNPTAPLTAIGHNSGQHGNRCNSHGVFALAPLPPSLVVPSSPSNNGFAAISGDGTTVVEGNDFTRCAANSLATVGTLKAVGSIAGSGQTGGAGGSGLSTLGGLLRVNELVPGGTISHALRVNLDGAADLLRGAASSCYRWPAVRCDGYGPSRYGGHNPALKMGALLALPAGLDLSTLGLSSGPGMILARSLQHYGAYVSNDTARPVFSIATEAGDASAVDQFQGAWGFSFTTKGVGGSAWADDIMLILRHLAVVNNNGPSTVGGGGTPLVAPPPPLQGGGGGGPTPNPTPTPAPTESGTPTPGPSSTPNPTGTPVPTPSPTVRPTATPTPRPPTPTPSPRGNAPHVMVVMLENKGYAATLGTCAADPYYCSLASGYASYTNWSGVSHPSLPNYLAFTSGSTQGCASDGCPTGIGATDLGGQLSAAGIPWTAYMELMPSPCYGGGSSGGYARKHNPFAYFTDDAGQCHVQPYPGAAGLVGQLNSGAAGDFVWVTPNLINDMHDGTVQQGDAWLSANIPAVLASSWFANNGVVIVTMDEGDAGSTNQIPMVVISHTSRGQGAIATAGNHYGTLRAIEQWYGLGFLGAAATAGGNLVGSF